MLLLTPVVRPTNVSGINLQKTFLPPTGRFNLGFLTEGKLAAVLIIIPSSWGFPTRHGRHQHHQAFLAPPREHQGFLAPLPGRKKLSARGVSHSQSLYFVFVLLCLFYFVLFASLYQKHKKISFLYSCYFCFPAFILIK